MPELQSSMRQSLEKEVRPGGNFYRYLSFRNPVADDCVAGHSDCLPKPGYALMPLFRTTAAKLFNLSDPITNGATVSRLDAFQGGQK